VVKRIFLAFVLLHSLISLSIAQYYSTGQDPASLRWKQIKTKQFRIIYPESFENRSQYLANIMEMVCREETRTLPAKVPRMPVIIHSQSSQSNGLTVWAPRRIEFYPCPPQDSYPEEWLEQLAIHEYRHAVQVSKMNQEYTRVLSFIFGEQALGAVLGLYIPPWFLEGDAVCTETALSNSGRGRTCNFESILRAQLLEKGPYSYDKAVLGSYRTFTPDAYELGYPMVAMARKEYGTGIWNTALDRTAIFPFMIVPFSSGIRKETGLTKTRFYRHTMDQLLQEWKKQDERVVPTDFRFVTKRDPKNFSRYNHPVLLNDSTIVSEKECLDYPDRFVRIDRSSGKEKLLLTLGSSSDESVSVCGDYLVWTEFRPDPRWNNRDYSVIRVYTFSSKKIHTLSLKGRYFCPFLSPDCSRIAAVFMDPGNNSSIRILDRSTGKILQEIPMKENQLAMEPNWSPDGNHLVLIISSERGKTIATIDLSTGTITQYLPFRYTEISGPAYFHDNHIVYKADDSGIQNISAVDTATKQVFQVTSARFAAGDPDFTSDRGTMIYADYCSDGQMIAETKVDTSLWIPSDRIRDTNIKLYESLVAQENVNIQDSVLDRKLYKMIRRDSLNLEKDSIRAIVFPSRKYSKILNLFNPHSWAPVSVDADNLTAHPGFMVLMQNVLSTTEASAGYDYDVSEKTGKFFANLTYSGLYPVFDFRFDIGNRASYRNGPGNEQTRFLFREMTFSALVSIPWNFSFGKFSRYLRPAIGTTLIDVGHLASTPENFTSGLILSMDYKISFSQYFRSAGKDIYPRWGQNLTFTYRHTPLPSNSMGSILAAGINLYFPGIFLHHGLWIYGGYQDRNDPSSGSYRYSNLIPYPRGYSGEVDESLLSLSFNYALPLFYPDWSLGSLFYFKRFKLNVFYDFAEGFNTGENNLYQSLGAELTADMHILRFIYPFELGVRTIFLPGSATWQFQFLYAVRI
jgi:hypothetical protein